MTKKGRKGTSGKIQIPKSEPESRIHRKEINNAIKFSGIVKLDHNKKVRKHIKIKEFRFTTNEVKT